MDITISILLDEKGYDDQNYQITLVNYVGGRDAPACSNPDSYLYDDMGDDPEWSETIVKSESGVLIEDIKLYDLIEDYIDNNFSEILEKVDRFFDEENYLLHE